MLCIRGTIAMALCPYWRCYYIERNLKILHLSNQTLFYNTTSNQDAIAAIPNLADLDGLAAQGIQDLESHSLFVNGFLLFQSA